MTSIPIPIPAARAPSFARSALRRALACCLALLALATFARAQSEPNVTAQLSSGIVKLGQDVRLAITVENAAEGRVLALPTVDGLRFGQLAGPSVREAYSYDGRRSTRSLTLTWAVAVQPTRKGEFRIPPITVVVNGKELVTKAELVLKAVEDLQGEELGWFEIDAPDQVAEGQPFTIELRFGWDAALNNQLNYANLSLPWLRALPGVVEVDSPPLAPNASTIELNLNSRERVKAERLPDRTENGRTFSILRLRERYIATRSGAIEIPTSHLEFGRIDESDGFFGMRRTSDKQTYYKRFPEFSIDVIKLPEAGRPIDYSGAVGSLHASASADRRDVDAGDSIKLSVEWTGDANLEFFEPPDLSRLDAFKGFRVYGTNDKKSYERRTVVYDIAPITPEIQAIPPVPLKAFDPAKKAYVTVQTDPIPIQVRALTGATGLAEEGGRTTTVVDIHDIQAQPVAGAAISRSRPWAPAGALGAVLAGWLALRAYTRRNGDPGAPAARARRLARKELARELERATSADDQARALERFLAARSGETPVAWLGRDVVGWSEGDGARDGRARLSHDDAQELAQLFARLDERTFAGANEPLERAQVLAVADRVVKGGL